MKTEIITEYRNQVKAGNLSAANLLLRLLVQKRVFIGDANDAAYQSGVARFLMNNCAYQNNRFGFRAYI